jgi:hypothetical protein
MRGTTWPGMKIMAAVTAGAWLAVTAGQLLAQVPGSAASPQVSGSSTWSGPRTPDGQPDVEGTWDALISGSFSLVTPMAGGGRSSLIMAGKPLPRNPSRIIDPPDGRVPYQPWAAALQQAQEKDIDEPTRPWHIDPQNRCLPQGVARGFYTTAARILQFPGQVVLFFDQYQYYRVIRLGGSHLSSGVKLWMGDPIGHWEGNTLVVEVTNVSGKPRLSMVGDFYSENARIVERYTFIDQSTLKYTATFEDPTVYTRPWTMGIDLKRVPNQEFWEFACHEGDRGQELGLWPKDDGSYDLPDPR